MTVTGQTKDAIRQNVQQIATLQKSTRDAQDMASAMASLQQAVLEFSATMYAICARGPT